MNATRQAVDTTSVTRDADGFMHHFSQLLCLGWGCGGARPAPGNARSGQPSPRSRPRARQEQQVPREPRSRGLFRKKGMLGVSLVQIPAQLAGFQKTLFAAFCAMS